MRELTRETIVAAMLATWGCGADPQEVGTGDAESTSGMLGDGSSTGSSSSTSSSPAPTSADGAPDTTAAEPASTTDLATDTTEATDGGPVMEPIRVMTYNIPIVGSTT